MTRIRFIALVLCAALGLAGCSACSRRSGPLGSEENPIRLSFMPLKSQEVFEANIPMIEQYLENATGLAIEPKLADDFITIVTEMGKKKTDVAFMNTLGFLLVRDWAGAKAKLRYVYGDLYSTYRGEIIARVDGDIKKPEDIAGKTMAYADPYSAGGYLYPLAYLREHNIEPAKSYFAGGHIKVVEDVYTGAADAGATFHAQPSLAGVERDARAELLKKYPDVMARVKILALTDEIPTGPIAVRKELPDEIAQKLSDALAQFASTANGRRTLMELYNITGFTPATDADYDSVQQTIKSVGKKIQQLVPGGAPYYRTYIVPGLE